MPPIRAQNDLRRAADFGDLAACLADTGGFRVPPVCALYEARPLALSPPAGFLPSLRCHAAVLAICFPLVSARLVWVAAFFAANPRAGFFPPLPTLPPKRYILIYVTVVPLSDETKRRIITYGTATGIS